MSLREQFENEKGYNPHANFTAKQVYIEWLEEKLSKEQPKIFTSGAKWMRKLLTGK